MVDLIGSKDTDENFKNWVVVGTVGGRWIGQPVDDHVSRKPVPLKSGHTSAVLYPAFEYSTQSGLNKTPDGISIVRQRLAVPIEQLAIVPVIITGINYVYCLADFPANARREIEQVVLQAYDILKSERARLANLTIVNGLGPNMPPPPGR